MGELACAAMAAAVFVGSLIQGSIGFAFGLISIPWIVLSGLPLEQSITLVLILVIAQTSLGLFRFRHEIPWREAMQLTAFRFVALPLGVWSLGYIRTYWTPSQIKQLVGIALLAAIVVQTLRRNTANVGQRPMGTRFALALSGISSGYFAGLVGMGGPPLVMWSNAREWSTQRTRALLWAVFLILAPWQLLLTFSKFGGSLLPAAQLALLFLPLALLGGWIGSQMGDRLSRIWMKRIVNLLLICIAMFNIFGIL